MIGMNNKHACSWLTVSFVTTITAH